MMVHALTDLAKLSCNIGQLNHRCVLERAHLKLHGIATDVTHMYMSCAVPGGLC